MNAFFNYQNALFILRNIPRASRERFDTENSIKRLQKKDR